MRTKREKIAWSIPWVFWFKVSWRPDWFKSFWKTRGANFIELQLWKFKVSIGLPWIASVAEQVDWKATNETFNGRP